MLINIHVHLNFAQFLNAQFMTTDHLDHELDHSKKF